MQAYVNSFFIKIVVILNKYTKSDLVVLLIPVEFFEADNIKNTSCVLKWLKISIKQKNMRRFYNLSIKEILKYIYFFINVIRSAFAGRMIF